MTTMMTNMNKATDKQIAFMARLAAERGLPFDPEGWEIGTRAEASAEIERLLALPKPQAATAGVGYYTTPDGGFIAVVENRAKTGTYAKRLNSTTGEDGTTRFSWDYEPGTAALLAGAMPLTIEQARAFGHLHGRCLRCLRVLKDVTSVENMFGPVCYKKMFPNGA